jgi:hypothetical protein
MKFSVGQYSRSIRFAHRKNIDNLVSHLTAPGLSLMLTPAIAVAIGITPAVMQFHQLVNVPSKSERSHEGMEYWSLTILFPSPTASLQPVVAEGEGPFRVLDAPRVCCGRGEEIGALELQGDVLGT